MSEALQELAALPQWVAHTSSKVPIGQAGRPASSTDASTWLSLADAKMVRAQSGLAGVGFVMTAADPYIGIDLDNAVDEEGFIKPWADEIVRELVSYTEISPSGRGLHIWVKGKLPHGPRRVRIEDGLLEVYDSARYFTVTGRHVDCTPSHIASCGWLASWYAYRFPAPQNGAGEAEGHLWEAVDVEEWVGDALRAIPADDRQVWLDIGMALQDRFGEAGLSLWNEWSKKSTKYKGEQDIFKTWRSFKSGGITIATLIKHARDHGFEPPPMRIVNPLPGVDFTGWAKSVGDGHITDAGLDAGAADFQHRWFDIADIARMPEEYEPDIIGPGVLGAGDMMLLFGPPKSMKSMVVLDWCRHWCQGKAWHGLEPARPLRIAYCQFEVKLDQVKRRIHAMQLEPHEVEALKGRCYITDRFHVSFGNATALEELADSVRECFGGEPADILVVDPLANVFTGKDENDNAQMTRFLHCVRYLRGKVGEQCAVVLVHHANKGDRRTRQADPFVSLRGASALRGAYDSGVFIDRLNDEGGGELVLKFELRNGPPIEAKTMRFESGEFVELALDEVKEWAEELKPKDKLAVDRENAILHALATIGYASSMTALAKLMGERWPKLGKGQNTWKKHIEIMLEDGRLETDGKVIKMVINDAN